MNQDLIGVDPLGRPVSIYATRDEAGNYFFAGHIHEANGNSNWGIVSSGMGEFQKIQTFPSMENLWPCMVGWEAQAKRYRIHSAAIHHAVMMSITPTPQTAERQIGAWDLQMGNR